MRRGLLIRNPAEGSLRAPGAVMAKVYGDLLNMEGIWNPYGLRIDSKIVGI
jgi:hypothetical protein